MEYRRRLLLFLCVFSVVGSGSAQSRLSGTVLNNHQKIIPYTSLFLTNNSSNKTMQALANSSGHFIFKNLKRGGYTLRAHTLGYKQHRENIQMNKDTTVRLILHPLQQALGELTVVGQKPIVERKADRIIFDLDQSISAAGSNLLDALALAPGVKISGNEIAISGKGSVAIMRDNRLLHLSGEERVHYLKSLSSNQVAKIEVITHPSAQYSAEGNAGIINIVTKSSEKVGFSGNIQGSLYRSMFTDPPDYTVPHYGYVNGSANINYNSKKLSAYASLSYLKGRQLEGYGIDVYYPGKHWMMRDTGDFKSWALNFSGGVDYVLSKNTKVGLNYQFGKRIYDGSDHVHVPVYDAQGKQDSLLRTYAIYYPIAYSNALNFHVVQKVGSAGGKLTVNVDYFNYYRNDRSDFETDTYNEQGAVIPTSSQRYYDTTMQNIKVYTAKADLALPTAFAQFFLGGKVSFINNYSNIYYFDKVDHKLELMEDLSNEYRYIENTQALYVSGVKSMDKWELKAGLRAEFTQTKGKSYFKNTENQQHYLKFFPSFLASYTLNDKNSFSLAFDKRIHRPSFWDLNPYKSLMTAYSYVEGNPYLRPEYATNLEVSHSYKKRWTSALYLNVINNGFTKVTYAEVGNSQIHTTPLNFAKLRRIGVSESLSFQPFHWMESRTLVKGYYTMTQSELPYIEDLNGWGLYAETNNTFYFNQDKTWMGSLNFWAQFPENNYFGRTDTYFKLDAGIQSLLFDRKLSVSLTGADLLQSSGSVIHSKVNDLRQTYTNFQVFSRIKLTATWSFGNNNKKRTPVKTGNEEEMERAD